MNILYMLLECGQCRSKRDVGAQKHGTTQSHECYNHSFDVDDLVIMILSCGIYYCFY